MEVNLVYGEGFSQLAQSKEGNLLEMFNGLNEDYLGMRNEHRGAVKEFEAKTGRGSQLKLRGSFFV